ncbi:MAG: hypothetical protein R6U21_04615 [Thermoplasmatota archaeon]
MKIKRLTTNKSAQVLGLPMYLIIVMVVAVAVIAAVIYMIPQGTQTMNALVTENAVIAEDPGNASSFTFSQSYDVTVKVTTNDDRADPLQDATVTLVGSGVASTTSTNANGIATLSITPTLAENINEATVKLKVKATGFEDFSDDDAITIYRL